MNDIEIDFTIPETNVEADMTFQEDFDTELFAVKGDKGDKGDIGNTGPQGPQGPQGIQGIQGEQGVAGQDGEDGKGISSIVKTSTSGLVDTYTITYTDNTTSTFNVTNGQDGTDGINGTDGADGRDGYVQYIAGDNITIDNNVISAIGGASNVYNWGASSQYTQQEPLDLTNLDIGMYQIIWDSSKLYVKVDYNNGTTATKGIDKPSYNSYSLYGNMSFFEIKTKVTPETEVSNRLNFFNIYNLYYSESQKKITFLNSYYQLRVDYFYDSGGIVEFSLLTTDGDQTISGKKTFSTLPESSIVPTTDNQLVNKKYVDDNAGGSGEVFNLGIASQYTQNNRLDLTNREPGMYLINWDGQTTTVEFKVSYNNTTINYSFQKPSVSGTNTVFANTSFLELKRKVTPETEVSSSLSFFTLYSLHYDTTDKKIAFNNLYYSLYSNYISSNGQFATYSIITGDKQQGITGKKIFSTLPESSVVPTTNNQFVNKKYVDDQVGAINTILATLTTPSGGE